MRSEAKIKSLKVGCYRIPTDQPEGDGTITWSQTTLVTVTTEAGGRKGFGYTYCHEAAALMIEKTLKELVIGEDAFDIPRMWSKMLREVRNFGRPGLVSCAIAAVDNSLWDLKARILDVPLVKLLGQVRTGITLYGSGGFTTYDLHRLHEQLHGWAEGGFKMVKMKVGAEPDQDLDRVRAAREAIGTKCRLFVDANGAYSRKQALLMAEELALLGVSWFEEPVSSDDLEGLRLLRDRAPAGMQIAAGEYGYDAMYFRRMLEAGAVDILQADATRCLGISGFMQAAALCESRCLKLSAHTAPSVHAQVCCALEPVVHLEYFYDHARIEKMLFDGVLLPVDGELQPDLSRAGQGLEFKEKDAVKYAL